MKKKRLQINKALLLRVCKHVNVYICFYSFHYCRCCWFWCSFISHAKNQKKKSLKARTTNMLKSISTYIQNTRTNMWKYNMITNK